MREELQDRSAEETFDAVGKEGFGVRVFIRDKEGELEPLFSADGQFFSGSVPNIGDTFAQQRGRQFEYFVVVERHFISSSDLAHGWCLIVDPMRATPALARVTKAWKEDTDFWRNADREAYEEDQAETRAALKEMSEKRKAEQKAD